MDKDDLITRYNYDEFVPEKFQPWMRWNEAPVAGTNGPDFPLWELDGTQTSLSAVRSKALYTIVEFGSFT